ncbi:MAG: DUF2203 domain-containing protein [Myxococcota bacterium]
MSQRYFTVEEANRMVPRLQEVFDRLLQLRLQMRTRYSRLESAGFAPEEEDFPIVLDDASPSVTGDRAALKTLMAAFRDELEELEEEGLLVKGVEPGLVDWYAHGTDGRDVLLCWRFGEDEITHWHEVDAGFAGRRPLEELHAAEPSGEEKR